MKIPLKQHQKNNTDINFHKGNDFSLDQMLKDQGLSSNADLNQVIKINPNLSDNPIGDKRTKMDSETEGLTRTLDQQTQTSYTIIIDDKTWLSIQRELQELNQLRSQNQHLVEENERLFDLYNSYNKHALEQLDGLQERLQLDFAFMNVDFNSITHYDRAI